MTLEDLKKCPDGFSPHNFECCETHGGQAFRNWYMLMRHKGIFIGFHNHDWVVLASSDPDAEWRSGCQDSCAYGDPLPQSKTARLIGINKLPPEAQGLALQWVEEAIEIARKQISEHEERKRQREVEEQRLRAEKHECEVVAPWRRAVAEEKEERQ